MTEQRYYSDIDEIKEVTDASVANATFKIEGWELIAIRERGSSKADEGGPTNVTELVYVFGHVCKTNPKTATSGAGIPTDSKTTASGTTTMTHKFTKRAFDKTCDRCGASIAMDSGEDGKWHAYDNGGVIHKCR